MFKEEVLKRINSCYVNNNSIQITIPYKDNITIINNNRIMCHYNKKYEEYINSYLDDKRKEQFPYSNIPIYRSRKYNYINQIFDMNKPYIIITNNSVYEMYAVKDEQEAIMINTLMPAMIKKENMNLEQLNNFIQENLFIIDTNNNFYNKFIIDEDKLSIQPRVLFENLLIINKNKINKIKVLLMDKNNYEVEIIKYVIKEYSLEQIRCITPNITNIRKPGINLKINKNIKKEDIKEAKQLIKR